MIGNMSEIVGFIQAVLDFNAPALSNHYRFDEARGQHIWSHEGKAVRLWFFTYDGTSLTPPLDFHIEVTTHYDGNDRREFKHECTILSLVHMHDRHILARNLKDALLK